MKYTIENRFVASVVHTVEAKDEGEALEKARVLSEEEDIKMFTIQDELESCILNSN